MRIPDLMYTAWDSFSLWSAEQPIFLQAAIGVALFWVALKFVNYTFRIFVYIAKSLFQSRRNYVPKQMPKRRFDPTQTSMIEEEKTRPYFFR